MSRKGDDKKKRDTRPRRMTITTKWEEPAFGSLSDRAVRIWFALNGLADDYGRVRANGDYVRAKAYMYDACPPAVHEITEAVTELKKAGQILLYEDGGEPYAYIVNWERDQYLRHRRKSYLPPPPGDDPGDGDSPRGGKEGRPASSQAHEPSPAAPADEDGGDGEGQARGARREAEPEAPSPDAEPSFSLVPPSLPSSSLAHLSLPSSSLVGPSEGTGREKKAGDGRVTAARPRRAAERKGIAAPSVPLGAPVGAVTSATWISVPDYVANRLRDPPAHVQRAFEVVEHLASEWGKTRVSTLEALGRRIRSSPERAIGLILGIDRNPKVRRPWGALWHALQAGYVAADCDLQGAKHLLWRPRTRRSNEPGKLSSALGGALVRLKAASC